MMVPSDYLPANKRSLFFGGEATIFLRDSKTHRNHDTQIVRMGYFWYWFRKMLVLIAVVSFTVAFLIPYLFLNSTDGYILSGGILSLVFCLLALLSYLHILPWRRHPSSLLIQVCGMSAVLSTVAVVMAYPEGGRLSSLNDGSDINIIGDKNYTNRHDHTPGCLSMSFILQLTLFAREMWILTLSLDLLTNITNPFASYKINLRKYHCSIWAASVLGAVLLVSQTGDCQGEFLNNGTCWIKISDVDSTCFWAYFMTWVILFYVNAIAVLAYAFSRISKGLESTYATHYSFVVDTFRIVVFFFLYGVLLASLFLVLYYASGIRSHRDTLNTLEHIFAFCIATRGFFDALIWFFTHGFTEESNGLGINLHHEETAGVTSMQALMKAISSRRLTMRDIFQPKLWLLECIRALPTRCTTRESDCDEELRQNTQAINGHEQGDSDVTTILLSSSQAEQRASPLKRRVTSSGDNKPSDDEEAGTDVSDHQLGKSRPTESTLSRSYPTTVATSTFDFSPQLNLALRAEVLYVVTLGIRESVLKLSEREQRLRQVAEEMEKELADGVERGFSGKESDGKTGRSFSLRRGLTSDSTEEDFVRIRLSSNSASDSHRQTDVSNILRDIYTTTTPFAPIYNNNNQTITRHSLTGSHTHAPLTSHNTTTVNTQQSQRHTRPQQRSQRYNPNNSLSFNPHASLAFHSLATSSLLFSLMSVTGAYIPGEYGVDAMAYLDDVDKQPQPHISHQTSKPPNQGSDNTSSNSQTNTPPRTPSKSNPNNPADTLNNGEERESKTKIPFEQPSASSPSPSPSKHHPSFYLDHLERLSKEPAEVSVELPPPPAEVIFNVNDKYRFRDFRPATFRTLRQLSGMSDEQYLSVISQPAQEKLSEGRSGAFFFVCGEGDVIVKTVEASEAKTLLSILDKYVTHLMRFPESLLVRFFGLHSIRMYGNDFTFVVMKNIFPKAVQLNEKYDIKGSYVARNATLKMPGKLSTCRYCHCQFIEGTSDRCSEVVGGHEAIITLKDNDMISKIRLYPGDAYQIIDTLLNDSDALCDMGLMDYSLLVGVKHGYYDVDWFKTSKHFATSSDGVTESKTNNGSHITTDVAQSEEKHIQAAYPARAVIAPKEYYFGVIDVLQTWSWSKKLEHFIKVYLFGQPADGVSCVDPIQFKLRYQRKIMRVIEHEGFVREVTGSWVGKREIGNPFALVSNKETENS